jgi:hypothetical protein
MTNQVCPIDNDQGAAAVERLVVAHAAYAALKAATVALDRVEVTVCANVTDPAAAAAYRSVAAHRLAARATLSAALRELKVFPARPC